MFERSIASPIVGRAVVPRAAAVWKGRLPIGFGLAVAAGLSLAMWVAAALCLHALLS